MGLHAVVGRNDENRQVGNIRPMGAHIRKSLVPWRINEGDFPTIVNNFVSADGLRYTAGFPARQVRFPDIVKKSGLSVVHVPHNGYDGRASHSNRRITEKPLKYKFLLWKFVI